jgi:hypothetical protein
VVEPGTPVRVAIILQSYDLRAARTAILRDNRPIAWLNLGIATFCFAAFVGGPLALAAGSASRLAIGFALFSWLLLVGGLMLFGARSLLRSAPTNVTVDSNGLSFKYPSGQIRRVSWKGRPRPFDSEAVVCDIWVRRGPTQASKAAAPPASIGLCPPYPRKTRFVSTTGLTADALAGILRAAHDLGLRVTEERIDDLRLPGFASASLPGTIHYVVHPAGAAPDLPEPPDGTSPP